MSIPLTTSSTPGAPPGLSLTDPIRRLVGLWVVVLTLWTLPASALGFSNAFRVFHEDFENEVIFPVDPEQNEILFDTFFPIAVDFVNWPASPLPELTGSSLRATVTNYDDFLDGMRFADHALGFASFGARSVMRDVEFPAGVPGLVPFSAVFARFRTDSPFQVAVGAAVHVRADPGEAPVASLDITESSGEFPPNVVNGTSVLLPAIQAEAIASGAAFVIDVFFDRDPGTAFASVEVDGFSAVSAPALSLVFDEPEAPVSEISQIFAAGVLSELNTAPIHAEFESFSIYRG